ncbi:MAG: UDP-N-acetylmuramoyl-L-alanine--D-glutamate ligase [Anaerolineaceae bacterium]|nr:UDP-N-acetylmuramoyl-L-alanine--D-glutamate ligase [Anaerolineaceae bacterium]MBN2676460.1 UDP-N-acetylmuramoyl-L-alanine--D-glutamate ligase [Anaerolineaceae bacterium]
MSAWLDKNVLVIGAARQGQAAARHLAGQGAHVILNDQKPAAECDAIKASFSNSNIRFEFDGHPLELLKGVDLVCVSGGVPLTLPLVQEAYRRNIHVTNDSQLFMENVPCPVIGITGSAGKTTTTTLVGRMAQAAVDQHLVPYRKVWVGGNIGTPLIDQLDRIQPNDLVILEFSSFQLELMTSAPHVATILNITPNHLDRHTSMAAYTAAKQHILDHQKNQDIAVLNREDPGAFRLKAKVKGRLVTFGLQPSDLPGTFLEGGMITFKDENGEHRLFSRDLIELRGEHNVVNVMAAAAIAWMSGIPAEPMIQALSGFKGVAHRLEYIRTLRGTQWYNDSIATAPERTAAAILSFNEPLVLLLGGRDKDLPWEDLVKLIKVRVKHVVLFGEAAGKIFDVIAKTPASKLPVLSLCYGLEQAVHTAASFASEGDVVLFSPGGTSYDEFHDFEERGDRYKEWVNKLT